MTGGKSSKPDKPSGLFPDNLIHLGGDEVNTKCWTSTPAIKKWLDAHGLSADDGYAYFVKRAASIAIAQGRRPIQWVEVFDHFGSKLDKSTIVHVWKAKSTLTAVVAAGYNALINNSPGDDSWYLDHLDIAWKAYTPMSHVQTLPTQSSASSCSEGRARCGARRWTCPTSNRRCGRGSARLRSASGARVRRSPMPTPRMQG